MADDAGDFGPTLNELRTSFPDMLKIAGEVARLNAEEGRNWELKVKVPTAKKIETKIFNNAEWKLLQDLFDAKLARLAKIRNKRKATGRAHPEKIIILANEMKDFIVGNKKQFEIKENPVGSRDPFAGGKLALLEKQGLALQSTVANLLRAYNKNNNLYMNATHNQDVAALSKAQQEKQGVKLNKGVVGVDQAMTDGLPSLLGRIGPYFLATKEARDAKKAEKASNSTRAAASRLPPTDVEEKEGFDPQQFSYNSIIQTFIKLSRKHGATAPPEKPDIVEFGVPEDEGGILSDKEAELIAKLTADKVNDKTGVYEKIQAQDRATARPKTGKKKAGEDE